MNAMWSLALFGPCVVFIRYFMLSNVETGIRQSAPVILTVSTFIFCIFPFLLSLHFQFTVCVSISTFSLSICVCWSSSVRADLACLNISVFFKRHLELDSWNLMCDWHPHQAPSSLLDALEQHLASLEGKKVKDSTAASRYVCFRRPHCPVVEF